MEIKIGIFGRKAAVQEMLGWHIRHCGLHLSLTKEISEKLKSCIEKTKKSDIYTGI